MKPTCDEAFIASGPPAVPSAPKSAPWILAATRLWYQWMDNEFTTASLYLYTEVSPILSSNCAAPVAFGLILVVSAAVMRNYAAAFRGENR